MNDVVHMNCEGGIALVTMEDRVHKNTFSPGLVSGLKQVFGQIEADERLRVVVITGFDAYFCCGGTREELLAILDGRLKFTDQGVHDLLLRCSLPVIVAMQGHAIGGGLVFAAYGDILILGAENFYSANFMKYGFTPGMGGTLLLPHVFGPLLGKEMLMTARNYQGQELQQRGAPVRVVAKAKVLETAMAEAKNLAGMERKALLLLKERLSAAIRQALPAALEHELAMHAQTFVGEGVQERIMERFGN